MDRGVTILQQGACFMRQRLVIWVALFGLAILPAAVRSQETTSDKPTIAVRVASIDSLLADAGYIAELLGKGDEAKNLEGIVKARSGGIDTKKPFGFYANIVKGLEDAEAVVLLPVNDEDAFVTLVGDLLGMKPKKDDDGIYTISLDKVPVPIQARFANGYCYVSNSKPSLAKNKLLAPAAVLPAGKVGVISAAVQIDRIPDKMKQMVLGRIDLDLAKARDKGKPGESEEEAELRKAILDQLSAQIKSVLREGGPVEVRLDVDRTAGDLSLSVSVGGKPGSDLAASISDLAKNKSIAAAIAGRDAAVSSQLRLMLPAKLKAAVDGLVEQLEKKAVESANNELEKELRDIAFKAIKPTLKSGELDSGFDLRASGSKLYTLVLGSRIKDGASVDKALRKIIDKVPDEVKNFIKLDADKADSVAIHKITPPEVDAKMAEVFGNNPVYLAIRDDAILVALGEKGLDAIKEAAAATPKAGRIFGVEASIARLAPLLEKEHKGAVDAAAKAFGKQSDNDRVRVVIEGGDVLQIKLTARAQVLKFAAAMEHHGKGD
jgi:hypothetical protein